MFQAIDLKQLPEVLNILFNCENFNNYLTTNIEKLLHLIICGYIDSNQNISNLQIQSFLNTLPILKQKYDMYNTNHDKNKSISFIRDESTNSISYDDLINKLISDQLEYI